MGAPRHRILRLRIELRTDDSDEGARLQRSLGGLARRRVIPLVEQLLDARSTDEETCRIEHVKIELGEVDSARLEEQLVAGLRDQLGPALSQAIAGARATERAEAAPLELLTCFARTGALPWWAPIERADLVDDALTTLAREQPTRLVAAILSLSRETPTIPRLAAHCSESTLALVIDLLRAPSRLRGLHQGEGAAAVIEELAALIAESGAFLPGTRGRRLLWRCLLEEVCVGGSGRPRERYAAILRRAAALGRLRAATLLDALARYERPRHGRRGHADAASSRAAARPGDEDEASQRARGEAVSVPVQTPRDEQVGTPGDVHELRAPRADAPTRGSDSADAAPRAPRDRVGVSEGVLASPQPAHDEREAPSQRVLVSSQPAHDEHQAPSQRVLVSPQPAHDERKTSSQGVLISPQPPQAPSQRVHVSPQPPTDERQAPSQRVHVSPQPPPDERNTPRQGAPQAAVDDPRRTPLDLARARAPRTDEAPTRSAALTPTITPRAASADEPAARPNATRPVDARASASPDDPRSRSAGEARLNDDRSFADARPLDRAGPTSPPIDDARSLLDPGNAHPIDADAPDPSAPTRADAVDRVRRRGELGMSSSPDFRQVAARPGGELVERPRPERLAPLDSRRARGRERARVDPRGVADVDLSFSDSERLPVGNAGLILLWPFLGHFFSYLGLAEGGALLDPSARMRAAGLLQVVATGARDIVEYQLPLPKLLVGLDLFDVIEFGEPVTDAEDEECGRLLSAVIERAPILGAMSIGGLRGSFLLREGLLSSRDESWLLQVERRAYDVVLDRFPWSLGWVKLPWMVAPMQVEW